MWDIFTRQYICVKYSHILYNKNMNIQAENLIKEKLLSALRLVLRPLVRLCLAQGVNYKVLMETLKITFVQVAEEEFNLDDRQQTDSRISFLTGLHRKDVHRIRNQSDAIKPQSTLVTLGSRLVGLWISAPAFIDDNGEPKALPRLTGSTSEVSFDDLVATVSKDIRARSILDEWIRVGVVHVDDNDYVRLNIEAFIPRDDFEGKLFFFQKNLHDHASANVHNMMNVTPPMFERCVYYNGFTFDGINELKKTAEQHAMLALKAVNAKAIELQTLSNKIPEANQRFTYGIYFYHTKENKDDISDDVQSSV
ncbi:MAG: DUF6502 family protein [Methylophilaceae bacterium]